MNGSETMFYTVEVRRNEGYDRVLPTRPVGDKPVVIIHQVDTGRWDRQAQVVDADGNGNPSDIGAMWTVGETFTGDDAIKVSVVGETADGFMVYVENGGYQPPPPSQFTLTVGEER